MLRLWTLHATVKRRRSAGQQNMWHCTDIAIRSGSILFSHTNAHYALLRLAAKSAMSWSTLSSFCLRMCCNLVKVPGALKKFLAYLIYGDYSGERQLGSVQRLNTGSWQM